MGRPKPEQVVLPETILSDHGALSAWVSRAYAYGLSLPRRDPKPRAAPKPRRKAPA
jgi:hypothetical protein